MIHVVKYIRKYQSHIIYRFLIYLVLFCISQEFILLDPDFFVFITFTTLIFLIRNILKSFITDIINMPIKKMTEKIKEVEDLTIINLKKQLSINKQELFIHKKMQQLTILNYIYIKTINESKKNITQQTIIFIILQILINQYLYEINYEHIKFNEIMKK